MDRPGLERLAYAFFFPHSALYANTHAVRPMDQAMTRAHTNFQKGAKKHRADRADKLSHPQPKIRSVVTEFEAPGDAPLAVKSRLTLQKSFRIDRALVERLRRREVNVKEAFTIRD